MPFAKGQHFLNRVLGVHVRNAGHRNHAGNRSAILCDNDAVPVSYSFYERTQMLIILYRNPSFQ